MEQTECVFHPLPVEVNTFAVTEKAPPIIELVNITKRFPGVLALNGVSLSFHPGEIHAVIGENGAGKSTLMNILAGELQPDLGQVIYRGKPQHISSPYFSQRLGISVVYQELALCPNLTIAENISLHSAATRYALGLVNKRQHRESARSALQRLGLDNIDLQQPVGKLSVALQQLVEIAKAISIKAQVLILDEPNSALTKEETDRLFDVLRQLRSDGVAVLYVSHRLEEVLSLADRISILRDGKHVGTVGAAQATMQDLIEKMVGRVIGDLHQRNVAAQVRDAVALETKNLASGNGVRGVSFKVNAGEIVGIAGLPDAGKDELVDCLFGLKPCEGAVWINGREVTIKSPAAAIQHGLVLVPADRRGVGALIRMNVQDNIAAANLKSVSQAGLLRRPSMRALAQKYVGQLDIRAASLLQQMATLSGGNQQKVILSRGLATRPTVLLLHEPTHGVDVGAKAEIYSILQDLARQGVAIVIVSSELPELIGQCDRILVMHAGRIAGQFARHEAREEPILACAMGQATHLIDSSEGE